MIIQHPELLRDLLAYAREASIALMQLSGGGSEMFKRIGEEYYAEPDLCVRRANEKAEHIRRLYTRPIPLPEPRPTPSADVVELIEALRLHAHDDCDGQDIPTHICNIAADYLAALPQHSDDAVAHAVRAIEPLVRYHETGGHEGDGSDESLKLARAALTALGTAAEPGRDDPNCGHSPVCGVWIDGKCNCQPVDGEVVEPDEIKCAVTLFRSLKGRGGKYAAVKVDGPLNWTITDPRTEEALLQALETK